MFDTFLKILPLALGGAVNPLGIIIVILLLTRKDNPLKRAWFFLAGFSFALIILAIIAQPLLKYTYGISFHQNTYSAIFDLVIGFLLIFLAIFHKKKQQKTELKTVSSPWHEFITGFLFMVLIDFDTLLFYLATIKIIFDANLNFIDSTLIFIISILIIVSTMAIPALLATIMPKKSEVILDILNRFMTRRGQLIGKIIIIIIAIYLIYKCVIFFF